MPDTFVKIASVTVGSGGASSIDFTSIPSTYTDLCIKVSGRIDYSATNDYFKITFNGSSTGYTDRFLYGTGSVAGSASGSLMESNVTANTATANTFGNSEIYIPNYASVNYKSASVDSVTENNATAAATGLFANLWSNTAAITQITLTPEGGGSNKFLQYSTAVLYGIKNS